MRARLRDEALSALDELSDRLFTLGDVTYTTKPSYPHRRAGTAAPSLEVPTSWRNSVTRMTRAEMDRRLQTAQAALADPTKVVCAGCGRALEPDFMRRRSLRVTG